MARVCILFLPVLIVISILLLWIPGIYFCEELRTAAPGTQNTASQYRSFMLLEELLPLSQSYSGVPKRICIAIADLAGPVLNGGIGTAYRSLAVALASRGIIPNILLCGSMLCAYSHEFILMNSLRFPPGHNITILFTLGRLSSPKSDRTWNEWVEYFHTIEHIQVVAIPKDNTFSSSGADSVLRAYEAFLWLRNHESDFDVLHFHDWKAPGFWVQLAKQQGLAFQNVWVVVGTHNPSTWHLMGMHDLPESPDEIDNDFAERRSVELADVVVSPSRYMLQWMESSGWILPSHSYVWPNVLILEEHQTHKHINFPVQKTAHTPSSLQLSKKVEFVFFGRLEHRKELYVFMDALESLCTQPLSGSHRNFSVVFLGRSLKVELQNEIALRANSSSWCFSWKILDDLDMTHARQFLLSSPKFTTRFAVIPSFMDNLPYTLMECIELNIPFIASDVGGNRELLNPSDIRRVLFQPTKVHLARRLWEILNLKEPWILPRLSVSQHRIIEVWDLWHCSLPPANQDKRSTSNMRRTPLVSVIIPTHNPTRFLADAIASISAQTYQNFEIIVVNDGSTDEPAMQLLNQLSKQAKQEKRQWKFIDIENSYVGAARNAGVQYAHGEYILFMDDDNVAKANELEIFVHVALRTQVDILTCLVDVFEGNDTFLEISQADMKHVITRWLPLGNAGASGVFNNRFGDANMFVSRTAFLELEGFSTDFGIGFEDWEFLARASLRGFRIDVVPEALFWKRERPNSMTDTISSKESTMRALRPYFYYTPHFFRLPLLLAHNLLQMKPLIVIRSEQAFSCIPGHYGWYLGLSNKTFHGISALEFHANVTISVPEQSEVRCGYSGANSDLIPSYAQVTRNMMHPVGSNTRIGPLRAVHRWVSFLEGKFLWKATLGVDASCGDGVELQLRIDGDLKWNRKIQAHEEMFTVSFPFAAVPGTVTEFIVDPIGNDWCDSVRHTIEIAHITDL